MNHPIQEEADLISDPKVFGFWIYLMTDLIVFAALFATYIVLRNNTYNGPSGRELFELPIVLLETLILLVSSYTCALGMLAIHRMQKTLSTFWFAWTFTLGIAFLSIEIWEFSQLINQGSGPNQSAFLSAYFTLVGTHGLHIFVGLLWMGVMIFRIWIRPFTASSISKIFRMALFWHFLDFVWIFIFTTVYGVGLLS